MTDDFWWITLSGVVSSGIAFIFDAALIVIALTTVRRRRPEAGMYIAAAGGVYLLVLLTWPLTGVLIPRFGGGGDTLRIHAAIQLAGATLRGAGSVLLLLGIVKLATPPGSGGDPTRFQ